MHFSNEEELHHTVLHAPIGICILNADTLVAELVNDKFLEVAGKPYEKIYGQYYWDAFAEAKPFYQAALARVVQTGEAYYADEVALMLIRHGWEEKIFVTFVYAPVKDKAGEIVKVAVWVLENTKQVNERQRTEADKAVFQRERDRLKRFFMQAPSGICILDGPELIYELVNPAYQQLFSDRQLLGRPVLDAMPELSGTVLEKAMLNVYRTGQPYEIKDLLIPLAEFENGPTIDRYFSFNYEARRDENNEIDGILAFVFEVTHMVRIQQELRQAREQADQQKRVYETITSGTPDLMYVFGLDYRFTYANQALLSMWGKTWDNAIGKSLIENGYEAWHAEMHEREIDQVKATRQPVRGEVSFPHATLGTRIYDYIFIPVLDERGNVEAIAGTTRDITELKQSQKMLARTSEELQAINEEMAAVNEELSASNEELSATNEELAIVNKQLLKARRKIEESEVALRLAINAANFGTWFIHSVSREFVTDARLKELFGYHADEDLSIEAALAQISEEYRNDVADKLEKAINGNGDYDVTYPVVGLHDKRLRWLRAIGNLKADPSGAFSAFTGVVMDVTEQQQSAQKIERAEEGLRMAIESGELAVWHLDQHLGKIVASHRFHELFGFESEEEVSFESAINQIDLDYQQVVRDAVAASFANGANFNVEYPVTGLLDHKKRWVRSVGKYVKDEKNGDYITGVMADITEPKMDEMRKNDFIGMVSHELKTPLTSMKGYIQVLLSKQKQRGDLFTAGLLEKANTQIAKMTNMINGFLNVSRLESGKIHMDVQIFDFAVLVKEAEDESLATITSHTVAFEPVPSTFVNADRDKVGQVIHNLISNAVKYAPAGSVIGVSCVTTDGLLRLSVKDSGMGINPDDLSKIFDRYYRVEGNQMHSISGFGIGLYLCREIIQRHHGEISAESEIGKGSTFTFTLPCIKQSY